MAELALGLQLLGAAWRLLGQLAAVEGLAFALLRPWPLRPLHRLLAALAVKLGAALQALRLVRQPLTQGAAHRSPPPLGHALPRLPPVTLRTTWQRPQAPAGSQPPAGWGPVVDPHHPSPTQRLRRRGRSAAPAEAATRR
jgi:hypothetical protein